MSDTGTHAAKTHGHHRPSEPAVAPASQKVLVSIPFRSHLISVIAVSCDDNVELWFAACDVWHFLNAGTSLEGTAPPTAALPVAMTRSIRHHGHTFATINTGGFCALAALGVRTISVKSIERWISRCVRSSVENS